jgi:putative FmdB family regulatory protein
MPIFEFTCDKCDKKFERILSYEASEEEVICPCDKQAPSQKNKTFSFNFTLKGNWFKNNRTY